MSSRFAHFLALTAALAALPSVAFAGDVGGPAQQGKPATREASKFEPRLSAEPLNLSVQIPSDWHAVSGRRIPPPLRRTGTQIILQSKNGGALILISRLQPEPRSAKAQATALCPMLADEFRVNFLRAQVSEVSEHRAFCSVPVKDYGTARATVVHLGDKHDTQLRVVYAWRHDEPAAARAAHRAVESLRLAK